MTQQPLPRIVRSVAAFRDLRASLDARSFAAHGRAARVAFVPTMGALHTGHAALLDLARGSGADYVVASVFVNPTQFAPHEDLARYPRTWDADVALLASRGVDAVFAPSAAELYPTGAPFRTFVDVAGVDVTTPEGTARPGFFRGVATVVSKLFNIVRPTDAWFGQKDGVQCIVARALARDLSTGVRVHIGATVREDSGLALSSRNAYLTPEERTAAPVIHRALLRARSAFEASPEGRALLTKCATTAAAPLPVMSDADAGARAQQAAFRSTDSVGANRGRTSADALVLALEEGVRAAILAEPAFAEVQYATLSDALTGERLLRVGDSQARNGAAMLSVVARAGTTRLLDNIMLVGSHNDLGAAPGEAA